MAVSDSSILIDVDASVKSAPSAILNLRLAIVCAVSYTHLTLPTT